jgi:hypothetical protein
MATTSNTGLVKNTDFSAELLLNKVMNKQYKTQSGNTLTLAGRLNASQLDSAAQRFGVQAENVAKAATFADGVQDSMTELLDLTKQVQSALNSTTDEDALRRLGTSFTNQFTALVSSSLDNVALLGGTKSADLGLGSGTFALGQADIKNAYANLTAAISSMNGGSTSDPALLDTTVAQLNAGIAAEGSKATLLHNRYEALNDLASSYLNASNDQAVTEGGSATSLLNSLL